MNDTRPGVQHRLGVDAGVLHRRHVVPGEAVEALHHEHPPRHVARVRTGHDRRPLTRLGEHARDVEHVLGLEPEVELLDDRLREQLDERGRVGERGDGDAADEARREPRHGPEIELHEARPAGRCTFTTTSSPVRSVAACTCAIDAAAIGSRSKREKTDSIVTPRSDSTTRRTCSNVSGGTRSRSSLNSATSSGGNRPSPDEMIWPILM